MSNQDHERQRLAHMIRLHADLMEQYRRVVVLRYSRYVTLPIAVGCAAADIALGGVVGWLLLPWSAWICRDMLTGRDRLPPKPPPLFGGGR